MRILPVILSAAMLLSLVPVTLADDAAPVGPTFTIIPHLDAVCNQESDARSLIDVWKANDFSASAMLFMQLYSEGKCASLPDGTTMSGVATHTTDYGVLKNGDTPYLVSLVEVTGDAPPYGKIYVAHMQPIGAKLGTIGA